MLLLEAPADNQQIEEDRRRDLDNGNEKRAEFVEREEEIKVSLSQASPRGLLLTSGRRNSKPTLPPPVTTWLHLRRPPAEPWPRGAILPRTRKRSASRLRTSSRPKQSPRPVERH